MELIYFILCAYGVTSIIVYSHIFKFMRQEVSCWWDWACELLHCPMCTGFWVGVFLCGINGYTELFTFEHTVVNYFLLGSLSSGTSYILCSLIDDNGLQIKGES
jgi:hypothetical protein